MKISTTLFSLLCIACVHSQDAGTAAGAEATGPGGTASFSIGQVAYTTEQKNVSVTQGVQQSYQIPFATIVGINLRLSIYPNPVADVLRVEVKNIDYPGLQFQLYDLSGKLLASKKSAGYQTNFIMTHFSAGTYLLQVSENNKPVKSFKVIKN